MSTSVRPLTIAELFSAPNIEGLLLEYALECAIAGMPEPKPDVPLYVALEATGAVRVVGAFSDERLVGFVVVLATRSPHYSATIAVTESLFVAVAKRKEGHGIALLHEAERIALEMGAVGLFVSAPTDGRLAAVLDGIGFTQTNRVFFRGLA